MASVLERPLARRDLLDIWAYVADDNEEAADSVLNCIGGVLAMLSDNPQAGRLRPELATDLRSFPVGHYVVFYLPTPDGIEVIRVLSGYRDIGADDFTT